MTRDGDIIVQHLTSYYRTWVVTRDGSREPDPNVAPFMTPGRADAEQHARNWANETQGRIFLMDLDGNLSEI